jgi:purine-binding chemotaxis protein CheW
MRLKAGSRHVIAQANLMSPTNVSDSVEKQAAFEQFVVFQLDNETYAVPILSVTEVVLTLEITPVPNAPEYILGLMNLRGKVLPVLDLEKKFQLNREGQVVGQHIMVAESEQKVLFGILVDQVVEVLRISPDAIKPPPEIIKSKISAEYLPGVIIVENKPGTTIEGEESIVLILDLQKILSDKNIEELQTVQQNDDDEKLSEHNERGQE